MKNLQLSDLDPQAYADATKSAEPNNLLLGTKAEFIAVGGSKGYVCYACHTDLFPAGFPAGVAEDKVVWHKGQEGYCYHAKCVLKKQEVKSKKKALPKKTKGEWTYDPVAGESIEKSLPGLPQKVKEAAVEFDFSIVDEDPLSSVPKPPAANEGHTVVATLLKQVEAELAVVEKAGVWPSPSEVGLTQEKTGAQVGGAEPASGLAGTKCALCGEDAKKGDPIYYWPLAVKKSEGKDSVTVMHAKCAWATHKMFGPEYAVKQAKQVKTAKPYKPSYPTSTSKKTYPIPDHVLAAKKKASEDAKWMGSYKAVKYENDLPIILPVEYTDLPTISWERYLGFKEKRDLRQLAANIYTLHEMHEFYTQMSPFLKGAYEDLIAKWDETMQKYMFAACLGEFRHRKSEVGVPRLVPRGGERRACQGAAMVLEIWPERKRAAINTMAAKFADPAVFNNPAGTGVGGVRWAKIAEVLWLRTQGTLPAMLFIDNAFDVVHNGGYLFNKCNLFTNEDELRALLFQKADPKRGMPHVAEQSSYRSDYANYLKWKAGVGDGKAYQKQYTPGSGLHPGD